MKDIPESFKCVPPVGLNERCISLGIVKSESEFNQAFSELLKYLWLGKFSQEKQSIPMFSRLIDSVWHEWILFTYHYYNSCYNMYGCYMHHDPHVKMDGHDINETKNRIIFFTCLYEKHFGPIPPIWGVSLNSQNSDVIEACGLDPVEQCKTPSTFTNNGDVVEACGLDPVEQCKTPSTFTKNSDV